MAVHLVNPSHLSFGIGVITPRWLFVLAGATPAAHGQPRITDETLEVFDFETSARRHRRHRDPHRQRPARLRDRHARAERGATVVFGGIHATLYPEEAHELGGAHAVVKGDGDVAWPRVLDDAVNGGDCSGSTRPGVSMPTASWRRAGT